MAQFKQSKSGAAKLASLSATIFLISAGLCGANFLLVMRFVPLGGPGPQPGEPVPPQWPSTLLIGTGVLELMGIATGIAGLFTAWFWMARDWVRDRRE